MRTRIVLTATVLALVFGAPPAEAAQAGAGRVSPGGGSGSGTPGYVPPAVARRAAVRADLVGLGHDGKWLPGNWAFSAQTLRDLLIGLEYRDLAGGAHTQRLKLYAPDGAPYQQFTTEFTAAGPGQAPLPRVPGWLRVETRLPVGGTWITEHSLYGTWRFEVFLDAAPTPTLSHPFTLSK